jgi:hypothetical protein
MIDSPRLPGGLREFSLGLEDDFRSGAAPDGETRS